MSDNSLVYFDHAAATPLDERVFRAMQPYLTEQFYNPSSAYTPARNVRVALEEARHTLAVCIGAKKDEVIFTAGATESINLAFNGLLNGDVHAVIGATEHAAVREAVQSFSYSIAKATDKGVVTPDSVKAEIKDNTILVSITAADSELGTIQSLSAIAAILEDVRRQREITGNNTPLYFHSDASQVAGVLDINVARLGLDLLTLNAGKCYGPKQTGLLWIHGGVVLKPLIRGGGQERGLRAGTESVANAVGFATAFQRAQDKRHSQAKQIAEMRDRLQALLQAGLPDLVINGHPKKRLPSHLHVSLNGLDAERVVFALDMKSVLVATGAACAANKSTRSSVLEGVCMTDSLADGSLRLSLGKLNTMEQIEAVAPIIIEAIKQERML